MWGVFGRKGEKKAWAYRDELVSRGHFAKLSRCSLFNGVRLLRSVVFERAGHSCAKCGKAVTFESGEMNERKSRGRGGQRTVDNCEVLCQVCHTGRRGEHGPAVARRLK